MGQAYKYTRGDLVTRFWVKVDLRSDSECWEWQASLDTRGYGNFGVPRNDGTGRFIMKRAHRVAWELTHGPLDGPFQLLCHKCDNPKCCNPRHMFIGTQADNIADCIQKGRFGDRSGSKNGRAKLTPEQVAHIRESDMSLAQLAAKYGMAKSSVAYARRGDSWKGL